MTDAFSERVAEAAHRRYNGMALPDVIREAADTLDREEHRYVERFADCPNGCRWEYASAALVGDTPGGRRSIQLPQPILVQTAGPTDCDLCTEGTYEDDDAPWVTPLTSHLRQAADLLAKYSELVPELRRQRELGWPETSGMGEDFMPHAVAADPSEPNPVTANHAMGPRAAHDDGRTCAHHPRRNSWIIETVEPVTAGAEVGDVCLRTHTGLPHPGRPASLTPGGTGRA